MTAGLALPFTGNYPVNQGFDGEATQEPRGVVTYDAIGALSSKLVLAFSTDPGYRRHHHGAVDWGTPNGTRLRAMEAGIVVAEGKIARFADGSIDGEVYQIIQIHRDAIRQALILMTHLMQPVVSLGAYVHKSQVVAVSDNTGRSTGAHTHVQLATGPATASPAAIMWGTEGRRWNVIRCLEGHDQAYRNFLVPNVA